LHWPSLTMKPLSIYVESVAAQSDSPVSEAFLGATVTTQNTVM